MTVPATLKVVITAFSFWLTPSHSEIPRNPSCKLAYRAFLVASRSWCNPFTVEFLDSVLVVLR